MADWNSVVGGLLGGTVAATVISGLFGVFGQRQKHAYAQEAAKEAVALRHLDAELAQQREESRSNTEVINKMRGHVTWLVQCANPSAGGDKSVHLLTLMGEVKTQELGALQRSQEGADIVTAYNNVKSNYENSWKALHAPASAELVKQSAEVFFGACLRY